ncbi:ABC transporter ATP-binding protein [Bacillus safensis]|uniref:ABC transporter ATP-binding protein n=1 Tax=Bacillus safensis TaxID=561879 RepID=UPI00203CD939|nr:ABC transporter ATP-binding protein [Bacillus safensis]MCM2989783.1 ABC transporter ATP-binding protein [Bacillus safensis]
MKSLETEKLCIGYQDRLIVEDLNVSIPKGKVTTLIGPNGCGKSTILKTMSRIMKANRGAVYLNGQAIHETPTKEISKQMAILPQTPEAPSGLTVYELVSYGRFPHQNGFGRLSNEDKRIIRWALEETGMIAFHDRPIEALSGGQRQRVWIAMALAQETELLLLDEPTTYLDLAHQLEILQLLERLNREQGRTVLMVIHDLNHAARFSHYMIALNQGKVIKDGTPHEVMSKEVLSQVFHIDAEIVLDPRTNKPICLTYDLMNHERKLEAVNG